MGDNLFDAALLQFLGEGALAPPGDILRPIVGQDLLGRTVIGDACAQDFQDQRRRLRRVQPVGDDEAAVIVDEGDQIDPAILALQDEGEEVRLPELVGLGAFEGSLVVGVRIGRLFL